MDDTSYVEVLVVEDEPSDVEFVLRAVMKSQGGGRPLVIQDGAEALEFVFGEGAYSERRAGDRPKVILLDLRLSGLGGMELLRRLRTDERSSHVPVVVFTSSAAPSEVQEAYRLGANAYVQKPVDYEGYLDVIPALYRFWASLNVTPY